MFTTMPDLRHPIRSLIAAATLAVASALLIGCTPSGFAAETAGVAKVAAKIGVVAEAGDVKCVGNPHAGKNGWVDRGINSAGNPQGDWWGTCEVNGSTFTTVSTYIKLNADHFNIARVTVVTPEGRYFVLFSRDDPNGDWGEGTPAYQASTSRP